MEKQPSQTRPEQALLKNIEIWEPEVRRRREIVLALNDAFKHVFGSTPEEYKPKLLEKNIVEKFKAVIANKEAILKMGEDHLASGKNKLYESGKDFATTMASLK